MSCNCSKVTADNTIEQPTLLMTMNNNPDVWVDVIYNGGNYLHYVPSPTGILRQFGLKNYGLGKKGMKLKVHERDLPSLLFSRYEIEVEEIPVLDFNTKSNSDVNLNETLEEMQDIFLDKIEENSINPMHTIETENNTIVIEKPKRNYKSKTKV